MSKVIQTRIKQKKDTDASFSQHNPVLLDGEIVIVDTGSSGIKIKIGNGVSSYNNLPFFGTIYAEKPEYSVDEIIGLNGVLEGYNNTISQMGQVINNLSTQVNLIPVLPIGVIMI